MHGVKQTPLSDQQRQILELDRDFPDATPKDILGMLDDEDINVEYVQRIIHDFDLPDEDTITIGDIMSTKTSAPENESETMDTDDEPNDGGIEDETVGTERPIDTLGEKAKALVETIRENPEITASELYEKHDDTSDQYTYSSVRKHSHLIPEDATIWDTITRPEEVTDVDDVGGDLASGVIEAIRDDTEQSISDVAETVDTDAGYVTSVMQTYQHLLPPKWRRQHPSLGCPSDLQDFTGSDRRDYASNSSEETDEDVGEDECVVEVDENGCPEGFESPEEYRDHLDMLHDSELIDEDTYEDKMAQIEIDETDDESGGSDATISPPRADETADSGEAEPAVSTTDDGSEVVASNDKLTSEALEGGDISIPESRVKLLKKELENIENTGGDVTIYGSGIRHALTVLGVDVTET